MPPEDIENLFPEILSVYAWCKKSEFLIRCLSCIANTNLEIESGRTLFFTVFNF